MKGLKCILVAFLLVIAATGSHKRAESFRGKIASGWDRLSRVDKQRRALFKLPGPLAAIGGMVGKLKNLAGGLLMSAKEKKLIAKRDRILFQRNDIQSKMQLKSLSNSQILKQLTRQTEEATTKFREFDSQIGVKLLSLMSASLECVAKLNA